ncbi:hypothetical protein ACIBBD_10295 [Streptomyces sp. NPDC051315]|uniref:hypothetical protein n=1 Tax=Streptomyces sp. NPDC051315 TaxID=3365650 RepID=UPI0037A24AED
MVVTSPGMCTFALRFDLARPGGFSKRSIAPRPVAPSETGDRLDPELVRTARC